MYTLVDNRKKPQEKVNLMELIGNSKIFAEANPKISFTSRAIYEKLLQAPNSQYLLKQKKINKFLDPLTPPESTGMKRAEKESSLFTNSWTESRVEAKDSNQEGNAVSKYTFNAPLLKVSCCPKFSSTSPPPTRT